MPAPPQRYSVWHTGYLDHGIGVDGASYNVFKTDDSFGSNSPEPTLTFNSDDFPDSSFGFAYWPLVGSRTISESDSFGTFPDFLGSPGWCFSTVDVGSSSPADAGDFVPNNQGDLTRTYIPGGSQVGFDFYVGTDVSGTTLQAPEVEIYVYFFRLNIDTGASEPLFFVANTSVTFSAGSVEQVAANTTVDEDIIFERNEVLVVSMGCNANPPNPTLGGTVTLDVNLVYNDVQGGLGGDNTVRGAFDIPLRTYTQDEGSTSAPATGEKGLMVSKPSESTGMGESIGTRYAEFLRQIQFDSVIDAEEAKTFVKKNFSVVASSDGLEMFKAYKKFGPGVGILASEATKSIDKPIESSAVSDPTAARVAELFRNADSLSDGVGQFERTVTYIRSAGGVALGDIDPSEVRICIPITSLSEEGGSGGGTTVNVRPVFIFDG